MKKCSLYNTPKCSSKRNNKLYVQGCCDFFHVTIVYLKGNFEIKHRFLNKILTQKKEKHIFWLQNKGSTYTRVNTAPGDDNEHIKELIIHYQPIVEHQVNLAEWQGFVNVVQAKVDLKGKDSQQLLTALVQLPSLQHIFPNLHKLAVIALVNRMSRADCEGGFSALKRIKTRLQNRFSNRILNNLLIISIEGPEVNKMDHSIRLSHMLCSS